MFELPLFPLESVLFPGMSINLHIFEDRYKQMINLCIENRQPFGVVLIEEGVAQYGALAKPYMIGCTAHITRMQPRGQGRMDINAIGQDRFRIDSLNYDRPYLVGMVDLYPISQDDAARLDHAGSSLRPWVERYLEILAKVGNLPFNTQQLPADPIQLGYLAAAILQQISQLQKQELLEAESAVEMLKNIRSIYYREVTLLDMMIQRADSGGTENETFSQN
jgi:Lon protease-like protein